MKIWIDVLTPKQVLFFEPLINKLKKTHTVKVTSRHYREAHELIEQRGMDAELIGKHGGGSLEGKLDASIERTRLLTLMVKKFKPDLGISFCSPDAVRVCFNLQIKNYAYCNASHSDKVLRLTLPLVDKFFCPNHIPIEQFIAYGIDKKKIYQYDAMDEWVLVKNKSMDKTWLSFSKKVMLIRTVEAQASYKLRDFDIVKLIKKLSKRYTNHEIIILPRYPSEIPILKKQLKGYARVLDKVVDSASILAVTDIFVGSGGTMTTEAVLRGVPALSLNTAPNEDERYLVNTGMLIRAETIPKVIKSIDYLLDTDRDFKQMAESFMFRWENPHRKLISMLHGK